jgi:glycosyltransferase involved in cell wall biosynthesis
MEYSIVIPVYNEAENLRKLYSKLCAAMDSIGGEYEIIFVDDGSTDSGLEILKSIAQSDNRVKIIELARNFGQTAALSAGINSANGEIIILMDADLQNDPEDIPVLISKLKEGYDLVSGWRKKRSDPFFARTLPSILANLMIAVITQIKLHDFGCTLKAYRRSLLGDINLYGEMHRLIPVYAAWRGARITEVVVKHHPRTAGSSKYGLGRIFKVILDLITAYFFSSFSTKPIHFFGGLGLFLTLGGVLSGIVVLIEKYYLPDAPAHRNPLLLLAVFLFLIGFQMVMLGLLAEILIRTYFEGQKKPTYIIRSKINFK